MRYIIILTAITLSIWSCVGRTEKELLVGDLYFGPFRLGSYYNQSDSVIRFWETYFDTTNFETSGNNDKELLRMYQKLKDNELLYKPSVDILVQNDSVVRLYLDIPDYDKIKIHKRKQLQDNNKKVRIVSYVQPLDSGLFYCLKLKSIDIIDGETLQRPRKFRIEDYN